MIAFKSERQTEEAVRLWREAFHDDEDYIRFFLNRHEGAVSLTESVNGSLVSALYLLDGTLLVGSKPYKAFYLFAAATFKRFRRQGYMANLLQKAKNYAEKSEKQYIALVPAFPALFDYYAHFGYQTAFYADTVPSNTAFDFDSSCDRFIWSDAHIRYMREEADTFDYPLLESNGMLFSVNENAIRIPDPQKKHRIGMLLPLNKNAEERMPDNAYIGLTME